MTEDKKILKIASHVGVFIAGVVLTLVISMDYVKAWRKEIEQRHIQEINQVKFDHAECLDINILLLETIKEWKDAKETPNELRDRVEEALRIKLSQ